MERLIVRAVLFDFNGTLSDDELLLYELFREVFLEMLDFDMSKTYYFDNLAGLSDIEIVRHAISLREDSYSSNETMILAEKVRKYQEAIVKAPQIDESAVELVLTLSRKVPVGVVTGAVHKEVDVAIDAAGLSDALSFIIAGEDVANGKPDPEGYLKALSLLDQTILPGNIVVFEDSIAGFSAVKSAGMVPVAVVGTTPLEKIPSYVIERVGSVSLENCGWLLDLVTNDTDFRLQS